jgi:hypothetical protein
MGHCARCRGAMYCSLACQRDDWPAHSLACLPKTATATAVDRTFPSELPQRAPFSADARDARTRPEATGTGHSRWMRTDADYITSVCGALDAGGRIDVLLCSTGAPATRYLESSIGIILQSEPRLFPVVKHATTVAAASGTPLRVNSFYPGGITVWNPRDGAMADATGTTGCRTWETPVGLVLGCLSLAGLDKHDIDAIDDMLRFLAAQGADFTTPAQWRPYDPGYVPAWEDARGNYSKPQLLYPVMCALNTLSLRPSSWPRPQYHDPVTDIASVGDRIVRTLVACGAAVNPPDFPLGMSPLHVVVNGGRRITNNPSAVIALTRTLIDLGIDVAAASFQGMRSLEAAMQQPQPFLTDVAALLFAADANRRKRAPLPAPSAAPSSVTDRSDAPLPPPSAALAAAASLPLIKPRWFLDGHGCPLHYLESAIMVDCPAVLKLAVEHGARLRRVTDAALGIGHLPLLASAVYGIAVGCVAYLLSLTGDDAIDMDEVFRVRSRAVVRTFDRYSAGVLKSTAVADLAYEATPAEREALSRIDPQSVAVPLLSMTAVDLQLALRLTLHTQPEKAERADAVRRLLVAAGARTCKEVEAAAAAKAAAAAAATAAAAAPGEK